MDFRIQVVALLTLLALSTTASPLVRTNVYTVAGDQVIASEQWIVANDVRTEGTFRNDLFVSSNSGLQLSGRYEGNVWGASGAEAVVDGICERNVRLAGQTIRINGTVAGNVMLMATTISIGTNAVISGDARLLGNQIIVEGRIGGLLEVKALQTATISGAVAGGTSVTAPDIILSDDAHLGGDLTYTTGKELIPSEHVVEGRIKRIQTESAFSAARTRNHLMYFLGALLTGVAFISLFPMTTAMASLMARKSPLKCFLVGFVAVGALPFFGLISLSTAIGIPLGAIVLATWGILLYLSRIIMGLMIGTAILRSGTTSAGRVLLSMITGLAVIYTFTYIPTAIGGIIQLLVIWMGMGALLLALLQKRRLIIQVPEELKQIEALKNQQSNPTEE